MTHTRHSSSDPRVQRTRRIIQEALIELTMQKGFAAVTVRDITRQAGINRATFYRHFQDKFDLLDQYAEEVYQLVEAPSGADLPPAGEASGASAAAAGLTQLFEHMRSYATFYRVMLGQHGDPAFAEKIRQYVRRRVGRFLPDALARDQRAAELYLSYVASGSLGAIVWWLEHDMPYTPAEMTALSQRLSAADMRAVQGE